MGSYSIKNFIVTDQGDKITAVDWIYTCPDGTRGHRFQLAEPYGTTPLKDCTESVVVAWLEEQLPEGTTAELDRYLAAEKQKKQKEATLHSYTPHEDGPPTPVTQEIVVPEEPETADVTPKKKRAK